MPLWIWPNADFAAGSATDEFVNMEYTVVRTSRQTLAIYIREDATVEVRAPRRAKDAEIERFVRSKEKWIRSHTEKQRSVEGARSACAPQCGQTGPRGCTKILRLAADGVIRKKVAFYAKIMGVRPSSVRLTSARTRWGSCGARNNLCFSWRLVLTDDSLIDYVVVHELAHIRVHDHSPRFWAVVTEYLPDHAARRKALRAAAKKLTAGNW
jgi:predicted metal-dependent hydrolase